MWLRGSYRGYLHCACASWSSPRPTIPAEVDRHRQRDEPPPECIAAHRALTRSYVGGHSSHRAGVVLSDLTTDAYEQETLFDLPPDPCYEEIACLVGYINAKLGRDTIRLATTGTKRRWRMKQDHLSPRYTTQWSELV